MRIINELTGKEISLKNMEVPEEVCLKIFNTLIDKADEKYNEDWQLGNFLNLFAKKKLMEKENERNRLKYEIEELQSRIKNLDEEINKLKSVFCKE